MFRAFFITLSESTSIRAIAERSAIGKRLSHRFVAGMTVAASILGLAAGVTILHFLGIHLW